jgi:endonuclease YncB( thermonuclease family)
VLAVACGARRAGARVGDAHAAEKMPPMADYTWIVPATGVRVVDGDTIEVDLDLGWRVYRNREHIRVSGINAPERNTRAGKRAKAHGRQRACDPHRPP